MGDWRGMDTLSQYPIPGDIWEFLEYCFFGHKIFCIIRFPFFVETNSYLFLEV